MKRLIFATLAAAALVACATEDTIVTPQCDAIAFDNAFVDGSTKAIDPSITTGSLESFKVYGTITGSNGVAVNIFDGVEVRKNLTTGVGTEGWKYATDFASYWIPNNSYKFAAVVNGVVAKTDDVVNKMPTKLSYVADGTTDLLYAEVDYGVYTDGTSLKTVAFTFQHLLSKVKFIVKNKMTSNTDNRLYQYTVENVKLAGAFAKGVYTIGATTPWAGTESRDFEFGHVSNAANDTESNVAKLIGAVGAADQATSHYEYLLIPGTFNATITADIRTWLNGKNISVDANVPYTANVDLDLKPGYAYNLIIELDNPGDEIQFKVAKVEGWVETHTGYNPGQEL